MNKQYKLINSVVGFIVFAISLWQYTATLESAGSLWDCGEFVSCVYKLQVAHPPGAPFFMILGRIFTLFNAENPAVMVNFMSSLMSSGCVLFLFFTITLVAKKLVLKEGEELTMASIIAIVGSGAVGALACSFSDTMWFSAAEGEVYASSMFFISIVLWAVMKWNDEADEPHANRWLVFAAYMIGVSLGVHLLSLLVIPVAVLVYYFKKFKPTTIGFIIAFVIGFILLGTVQIGVVQTAVKLAGGVEYFFVNTLGLPFNIGFGLAWIILFGVLVFLIYYSHKIKHADLQLFAVCFLVIFIGFSSYTMVPIRSAANPPINMNAPKDAFSLLSYLNREQYGSRALVKGPLFDAQPTDVKITGKDYYQDLKTKKYEVKGEKIEYTYNSEDQMIFPRMGPTNDGEGAAAMYQYWTGYQGKPTFADNIKYFFNYQLRYMYWRYFMWNFAGRQDDLQGTPSNERMNGDWLSGIPFIDNIHLGGTQEGLPEQILNQKARNKFYLLPLLLGLIGIVYMVSKSTKQTIVFMLLFFVTGIALIIYTNQPPREPRERDYALAGSFFAFCIWIGLAVVAIFDFFRSKKLPAMPIAVVATILCLFIPYIMAKAGWDDHNRNGRFMARDFAINYLESCPPNAMLFTQGDNDTYPLWYAQEVEGIRTDVRIVNLSLLGVDWYINFLQRASNKSGPVPFYKDFTEDKYRGNNRDMMQFNQTNLANPNEYYDIQRIMFFVLSDDAEFKAQTSRGESVNYLPTTKLKLKVDRAAIEKYKVVPEKYKDKIVDEITWDLGKSRIIKYDLAVLAMVAAADWSRPICFSNTVDGAYYNGLDKYLIQEAHVLRFVPCRFEENQRGYYTFNTDKSYDIVMNKFKYGGLGEREMFVDENSSRIMSTLKSVHFGVADDLIRNDKKQEAVKVLEKARKEFQYVNAPYYSPNNKYFNILSVQWIDLYYRADAGAKSKPIRDLFIKDLKDCLRFYNLPNDFAALYSGEKKSAEELVKRLEMLSIMYKDEALKKQLNAEFPALVTSATFDAQQQVPMQVFR